MLRFALLAIGAAVLVALVFVLLPIGGGPRPEPRLLNTGDNPSSTSFTVRDAAPPTPAVAPPAAQPPPSDLDAVIQRLRSGNSSPATAAGQDPATPAQLPPSPSPPPASTAPAASVASPPPDQSAASAPPAPSRFPTVTAQGTRWRMARAGNGFTISIDIGGGRVADVHVLPAFADLDPAAINVRVDYLRETILQHFPHQSASYSFARDGSVSLDR